MNTTGPVPADDQAQTTSVPTLGQGFQEGGLAASTSNPQTDAAARKLGLPLGDQARSGGSSETADAPARNMTSAAATTPHVGGLRSASPAGRASSPKAVPSSPGRPQQSPGLGSPASSQIFERNVQEDSAAASSPAIPAHIATENHIPPVLESASKAITDDHLDPDAVQIVTHLAHQPASAAVAGGSGASTTDLLLTPVNLTHSLTSQSAGSHAVSDIAPQLPELSTSPILVPLLSSGGAPIGSLASPPAAGSEAGTGPGSDDGSSNFGGVAPAATNYGSLDSTDVRRLSFISFADVVHAEHLGGDSASMRESLLASPTSQPAGPTSAGLARSPSPMRSPVSPSLSAASGSHAGQLAEADGGSPPRAPGSPPVGLGMGAPVPGTSPPSGPAGELSIETMGQALRNTTSGDLSGVRSSIIMSEDSFSGR